MAPDLERCRTLLRSGDLRRLFVEELGWDHYGAALEVTTRGQRFALAAVAEKRGMAVYDCPPGPGGRIPDYATRCRIEHQVAKTSIQNLIVYRDAAGTSRVWQWVKREAGQPSVARWHAHRPGDTGEALVQKLAQLAFSLEEEDRITHLDVATRARAAFDVERVTKRFYERFRAEHRAFLGLVEGIADQADREWYASLTLNRLMFVYFIQRKGFLDGDPNYLRTRLLALRARHGPDQFDRFYRRFLLRLFHEGLGQEPTARAAELDALLGKVPYLNGGLFDVHRLEKAWPEIRIPDAAFERLFDFFDAYEWHLDTRPQRPDNEINPDVLGYIFEKYVNQKQMGAYYTREDITEYIARSTVVPYLLGKARDDCLIAFDGEESVWGLLRANPDRYIYPSVGHGADRPLPDEIAAGLADVSRRGGWNRPAADGCALPTETWREVVARRQWHEQVRGKLASGAVRSVDDLITLNLDVRQFAQDVVQTAEGPDLLRALWRALERVSVLDPTCGSGAFLFAALSILEPLYEACLERMAAFVAEADAATPKGQTPRYLDFRRVLDQVGRHPSRRYFIYKSIIVGNLYGVDIMEEAVEIAKLRLFLKLVAQVDRVEDVEPLPDVDFNLRAGNTLVGFASRDDVLRALTVTPDGAYRLPFPEDLAAVERVERMAAEADRRFRQFHDLQTGLTLSGQTRAAVKAELDAALRGLAAELDRCLAAEYRVRPEDGAKYAAWRASHQPFHWFAEFYGVMSRGGFDVIIGNPPYVELDEVKGYKAVGYATLESGNLYALLFERAESLARPSGRQGYIVPVSSVSTDRYETLQRLLRKHTLHYASFDDRPSRLFDGLEHIRLTIHLMGKGRDVGSLFSTRYNKWSADERPTLFDRLRYVQIAQTLLPCSLPKLSSDVEAGIVRKVLSQERQMSAFYARSGAYRVYYSRKLGYFVQALDFQPSVLDGSGHPRPPSEFKELLFETRELADAALCCLNSSLFYWFVTVVSDCRHVNKREVDGLPVRLDAIAAAARGTLVAKLARDLMLDLKRTSVTRRMAFRHDTLTVQCILPKHSKPILDEIDRVLARHYGFSDEELDFIVNYDIKYRMGPDGGEAG